MNKDEYLKYVQREAAKSIIISNKINDLKSRVRDKPKLKLDNSPEIVSERLYDWRGVSYELIKYADDSMKAIVANKFDLLIPKRLEYKEAMSFVAKNINSHRKKYLKQINKMSVSD